MTAAFRLASTLVLVNVLLYTAACASAGGAPADPRADAPASATGLTAADPRADTPVFATGLTPAAPRADPPALATGPTPALPRADPPVPFSGQPPLATGPDAPVSITGGQVTGVELPDGIRVFRGIPYAAPPVGKRRWRPPEPPQPWQGVRPCEVFGPAAYQAAGDFPGLIGGAQSEDCLYLNLWTPAAGPTAPKARGLPVMVWIHGGGFILGAGSQGVYDGVSLAKLGVIVVTINYRLGPFGFLAHPGLSAEAPDGVSGNYGLLDMIAALRWVHDNAAAFGGDPSRVTIVGESSGGEAVCWLLATPAARGLFQRAIAQSAPAVLSPSLRGLGGGSEAVGLKVAEALGCHLARDPVAALRAIPPSTLLKASRPVVGLFGKGNHFGPVVDGVLVPEAPSAAVAAGHLNPVPLIIGTNDNDGGILIPPDLSKAAYVALVQRVFGPDAPRILKRYAPAVEGGPAGALTTLLTDAAFGAPARATARAMAAAGQKSWLYLFTRAIPGPAGARGAGHGMELLYVFNNLGQLRRIFRSDGRLSDMMAEAWTEFARSGDPNGANLPRWPACEAEGPAPLMEFRLDPRVIESWRGEAFDLLDEVRGRMRSPYVAESKAPHGGGE